MSIDKRVALMCTIFWLLGAVESADKITCERYFSGRNRGSADPGCVGICQKECKNGTCDFNGACNCSRGYTKVRNYYYLCERVCPATEYPENRAYCVNKCSGGCEYGTCDTNGTCTCNKGFKNHGKNPYLCDPICVPKCRNGHCAPNFKCVCKQNFQIIEPYGNCGKLCQASVGCANGKCLTNGTCDCQNGYGNDGTNTCVRCKEGEVMVQGYCEKACNTHQECSSDKPWCSQAKYCTTLERCTNQCQSECQRHCQTAKCTPPAECTCDNGEQNLGVCSSNCRRDYCETKDVNLTEVGDKSSSDDVLGEERNWVIIIGVSITALVVLLGIVLGVVVRCRRRDDAARHSYIVPMTDMSRGLIDSGNSRTERRNESTLPRRMDSLPPIPVSQDTFNRAPIPVPRGDSIQPFKSNGNSSNPEEEGDTEEGVRYATPRFPSNDPMARVNPKMFGHLNSVEDKQEERESYMTMAGESYGAEYDPTYLNVSPQQDDNVYENFSAPRY